MVREITPEDLAFVVKRSKLVFVDCWAQWCGPCRALAPIMEELADKYKSNRDVAFLKMNTDNHVAFAMEQRINAIPCVLVFHNGEPAQFPEPGQSSRKTDRLIGLRPMSDYEMVIKQLLG